MDKTIFVLLDACQYEAASKYLGYLEHMIDYNKGAKYKVLGELPSLSKPMCHPFYRASCMQTRCDL